MFDEVYAQDTKQWYRQGASFRGEDTKSCLFWPAGYTCWTSLTCPMDCHSRWPIFVRLSVV